MIVLKLVGPTDNALVNWFDNESIPVNIYLLFWSKLRFILIDEVLFLWKTVFNIDGIYTPPVVLAESGSTTHSVPLNCKYPLTLSFKILISSWTYFL